MIARDQDNVIDKKSKLISLNTKIQLYLLLPNDIFNFKNVITYMKRSFFFLPTSLKIRDFLKS